VALHIPVVSTRSLGVLFAAVFFAAATGCNGSEPPTASSTTTTSIAGPPPAFLVVEPSVAAAGSGLRLMVVPSGSAEITWGQMVRLRAQDAPSGDVAILVGVRADDPTRQPAAYGPGEVAAVNDIAYSGQGELILVLPQRLVGGKYRLSLEILVRSPNSDQPRTHIVETSLSVV
jgi:hypothetical protein